MRNRTRDIMKQTPIHSLATLRAQQHLILEKRISSDVIIAGSPWLVIWTTSELRMIEATTPTVYLDSQIPNWSKTAR